MPAPEQPAERPDPSPGWPRTNARKMKKRYGRLKPLAETAGRAANGCIIWRCECDCGTIVPVATHNLTSGNTLSCGCLQVERSRGPNKLRGRT